MKSRVSVSLKAQAAMEYLLVMAFVFVILTGILLVAYLQSSSFQTDVSAAQIQKVGNQIVDAANTVYYAGPPTKKTIKLYFPDGIQSISFNNQTLLFTMQGSKGPYEYAVFASTNMTGQLRTNAGLHTISAVAKPGFVNLTEG
jgi:uncharacterized protein (UPF0333 family)